MRNYCFLIIGIIISIFFGFNAFAQDLSGITFPVAELGNCQSQDECAAYCDEEENMAACLDFAEEHDLMPAEEIEMARRMLELGVTAGPGGCQGQVECAAYCDDINHIAECISFAEEYDLIPPEELEEARKVAAAIEQGIQPPNCQNKTECDVYCQQPENMEECITFGEAAGLIPPEELEMAKKILELSRQGIQPPPCRGDEECDEYCATEEHFEQCITFAEAAGMVTPEDAAMARRTGGKGPGGCRGEEECNAFCEDPANMAACMEFGLEYGFIPPEEIENVKRSLEAIKKGVMPPPCQGEEECQVYCSEPEHMEECLNFSVAAGFMTAEEAERARQGLQMMEQGGPGGCTSEEECLAYCEDPANSEECINFGERAGLMSPEEAEEARQGIQTMQRGGPGGCQDEEECRRYCEDPANLEECMNFSVEQGFVSPEEAEEMRGMMQLREEVEEMGPPEEEEWEEGMMPPEEMPQPPSQEEIEQIQQQEMEEAIQQMMPEIPQTPPIP